MSMIKAPIVMKQNPIIMAEFEKAFSEVDHDMVNIILHSLQNLHKIGNENIDLFNYDKVLERKVIIKASVFKEIGKFGKNANKDIFESLKKIRDTSAVIRNFRDIDNRFVKARTISLIDEVQWISEGQADNREHCYEVQFNEWFLQASTKQYSGQVGNFTYIDVSDVSTLKGKHAKKLYEVIKSREYRQTTFSMNHEQLQNVFNLQGQDFSYIVRVINSAALKVKKLISFSFTPFKKDKLISFEIFTEIQISPSKVGNTN